MNLTLSTSAMTLMSEGVVLLDELSTAICGRIIELHGGELKVSFLDKSAKQEVLGRDGAIESITLTLPTGAPVADRSRVSCAECRITLQAMQYAPDLAEVTASGDAAKKSKTKEISHEKSSNS